MAHGNKILFWFREPVFLHNSLELSQAVHEGADVIPVYCFDPREEELVRNQHSFAGFVKKQVDEVTALRKTLQERGSNLLVVNHPYEKIIPSLARVLYVNRVITNPLSNPEHHVLPALGNFRNQRAVEIHKLLDMHSIPMVFDRHDTIPTTYITSFPQFPEINPGSIPYS